MSTTVSLLRARVGIDHREFRQGMTEVKGDMRDAQGEAKKTGQSIKTLGHDLKESASNAREAGTVLSLGLTAPILGLGIGAVKAAADMDSLRRGLDTITGSAAVTEARMKELREVAKLPGLGFEEAVRGDIRLRAVGLSAEMSKEAIENFGNALASVGGSKAELDGVILALTQIQAKGKVSAEEINQLQERVPQIRAVMQKAFGSADTEVLQKMGISSEEFIFKITKEFGKIPKVVGGIKNDFETLSDTIKIKMAEAGKSLLPFVSYVINIIVPAITGAIDAFNGLPEPVRNFLIVAGLIAATVGPAVFVIGTLVDSVVKLKDGWQGLIKLGGAVVSFFTAKTAAATVETGATVANTASKVAHSAAVTVDTGATQANTAATAANSGALGSNTAATGLVTKARGLFGGLSTAGKVAGAAGIAYAGWQVASMGNEERERRQGITGTPSNWADYLNPFHREDENIGRASNANLKEAFKGELTPRQKMRQEAADANRTFTRNKIGGIIDESKGRDAQFEIDLTRARTSILGTGEGSEGRAEAAKIIPMLQKRNQELLRDAAKLKPLIEKSKEDASKYWGVERDIARNEQEIQQLRVNASKEVAQEHEKAEKDAKEAYDKRVQAFKKAQAAAEKERQRVLDFKRLQQETHEAEFAAKLEMIDAFVANSAEDEKAFVEMQSKIPALQQEQEFLVNQMKGIGRNTKEYHEKVKEYWSLQEEINSLKGQAAKEEAQNIKKEIDERKKQTQEDKEMLSARMSFMKAQIDNNPYLSESQKKKALVPSLLGQFRQANWAVEGESESEKWKRLTEAENMKGQIIEAMGLKGSSIKSLFGNQIGMGKRRAAGVLGQLIDIGRSESQLGYEGNGWQGQTNLIANQLSGGAPIVFQAILDPYANPMQLRAQFEQMFDAVVSRVNPNVF